MRIQITARHCDVPESVKLRAHDQSEKLTRYDPRLAGIDIVFEEEKSLKRVEGILSIDRRDRMVATGEGDGFRAALDQMMDRAGRMLRKHRKQARDHQHGPGLSPVPQSEA